MKFSPLANPFMGRDLQLAAVAGPTDASRWCQKMPRASSE